MRLHFDNERVSLLFRHSRSASSRLPTLDQTFDGQCRKDGRTIDPLTAGGGVLPSGHDVDKAKVPAGLWLVADHGIYLMSNGEPALFADAGRTTHVVAYAREVDPNINPMTWSTSKRAAFGGDDGVVFLDAQFIDEMLGAACRSLVALDLTPRQIATARPARHAR